MNEIIFNTIEEAIEDFKAGKGVIVADDEDRENEGDLLFPASFANSDVVNFMAKECRGLICLAISEEIAQNVDINPMVKHNTDVKGTNFTQSVDADPKYGVTTGISAQDRATTAKVIIDENSKPEDLRRPGHIFPIIARKGGVLKRSGHTETGVDLARLAGLKEAALMCEIMKEDGTMARRDDLFQFAKKYGLKFITVAQLIEYRLRSEKFVQREIKTSLPTVFGEFEIYGYIDKMTNKEHVALVKDDGSNKTPLVRMHSCCLTGDVFHSLKCDCNQQLHSSLSMINEYGKGALVYILDHEGRGIGLINKLKAYALQDKGQDTIEANISLGFKSDMRNYGTGAQILYDLGYKKIKLITNNPTKIVALKGYGIEIEQRVEIEPDINKFNERYIMTKKEKMHHLISKCHCDIITTNKLRKA